jgi:hypothetical protein
MHKHTDTHTHTCTADPVPEVRAAALFALGKFIGTDKEPVSENGEKLESSRGEGEDSQAQRNEARQHSMPMLGEEQRKARIDVELALAQAALATLSDASVVVRRELVMLLACLVRRFEDGLVQAGLRAGWGVGERRPWDALSSNLSVPILLEEADGEWLPMYQADNGPGSQMLGCYNMTQQTSSFSAPNIPVPKSRNSPSSHHKRNFRTLMADSQAAAADTVPFPTMACTSIINALTRLTRDPVADVVIGASTLLSLIEDKIGATRGRAIPAGEGSGSSGAAAGSNGASLNSPRAGRVSFQAGGSRNSMSGGRALGHVASGSQDGRAAAHRGQEEKKTEKTKSTGLFAKFTDSFLKGKSPAKQQKDRQR